MLRSPLNSHSTEVVLHTARWPRFITAAAWCAFALIHLMALLFFASFAFGYWALRESSASNFLKAYRLGIHRESYGAVATAFASIALVHALLLLQLVVLSVRKGTLCYSNSSSGAPAVDSEVNIVQKIWRMLCVAYDAVFSPFGLLGVRGPCFDLLLLLREVVETALQTSQAYRMSQFLARAWLNQFYVSLLVLNCWLVVVVHYHFHTRLAARYFMSLVCDFILDFVSSIGVTLALLIIYSLELEPIDVFGAKWFDDAWLANATNEFQLILVASWADLALRLVFAVSMISNLNLLKRFVAKAMDPVSSTHGSIRARSAIVPTSTLSSSRKRRKTATDVLMSINHVVRAHPVVMKLQCAIFGVWGTVVLALHVAASFCSGPPQCIMQVRPWGITRPSCNLVLVDCYRDTISGRTDEVQDHLESLHAPSISKLTIRHCVAFEMPPSIQTFVNLDSIKLYNTSVAKWDDGAALTSSHHPGLISINLHRVRFPDGRIPSGLLSLEFPSTCSIFSFVGTNLREVPEDLDVMWPHEGLIDIGMSNLTKIPDSLLRLRPQALLLEANPIEDVPQALFELPGIVNIDLRDTRFSILPTHLATIPSTLTSMNLDGTSISFFPEWIDAWLQFPGDVRFSERISAAGSPYCLERSRIFAGLQTAFPPSSSDSRLMDASPDNWEYLKRCVACSSTAMNRYPIELDDAFNALR